MSTLTRSFRRAGALFLTVGLTLAACGSDDDSSGGSAAESTASEPLTISDAYSREPADGQTRGVVYGVVSNPNDTDITVTAATSSASENVELHETLVDDSGSMSMQERSDGFVIPANGEFTFEPGGPHVMLLDIDAATFPTDEVDVTLVFDGADDLSFTAEVRSINGDMDMDMDMDDMDMDDMDHNDGETVEMDMDEMEMDDDG